MSETTTTTPKIWIGCLAAYNAGTLHGEWVDAAVEEDEIWEAQNRVLRTSPEPGAEEHFIADYEGFGPWNLHEYENLTTVALVARMIEEHGIAFAGWLANDDSVLHPAGEDGYRDADEQELEEAFTEAYRGEWASEGAFVEDQVEDIGLPSVGFVFKQTAGRYGEGAYENCLDELSSYLDWDTITRDVMMDHWTYEEAYDKVHVFTSY